MNIRILEDGGDGLVPLTCKRLGLISQLDVVEKRMSGVEVVKF